MRNLIRRAPSMPSIAITTAAMPAPIPMIAHRRPPMNTPNQTVPMRLACGAASPLLPIVYALCKRLSTGAITNAATTTPRICMTCCFHGVEPTSWPHLSSCRLSPPIAAAQHTTPPIRIAAIGPAGLLSPTPSSSNADARLVEIVMPETGWFDEPTRPAMYGAPAGVAGCRAVAGVARGERVEAVEIVGERGVTRGIGDHRRRVAEHREQRHGDPAVQHRACEDDERDVEADDVADRHERRRRVDAEVERRACLRPGGPLRRRHRFPAGDPAPALHDLPPQLEACHPH